jgi:hypothetical protein
MGWLLDSGWQVKDADAGPDTAWALIGDLSHQGPIAFGQPSRKPSTVVIQASLGVPDLLVAKIMALPEQERDELLWDLRFALLNSRVSFDSVNLPLKAITIKRTFYLDDGARRAEFMNHVESIQFAIAAFFWTLQRRLGETPTCVALTVN